MIEKQTTIQRNKLLLYTVARVNFTSLKLISNICSMIPFFLKFKGWGGELV